MPLEMTIKVPFEDSKSAQVAWNSLRVDPEPKRSDLVKEMRVENNQLIVDFKCQEAKTMRVSVNSFFDLLNLVVQTMDKF